MKRIIKIINLIAIFGFIFVFSTKIHLINNYGDNKKNLENLDDIDLDGKTLKISKVSRIIHINNNWSETKIAKIVTGYGNFTDPYIIEDLIIEVDGMVYGILIENSRFFFKIENCTIYNSLAVDRYEYGWGGAIVLSNVSNAQLINNNLSLNYNGIFLENCNDSSILGNDVNKNEIGINIMFNSNRNNIEGNSLTDNGYGISLNGGGNNNLTGNFLSNNLNGILLEQSESTTISGNFVINNRWGGIIAREGVNYTVSKNILNNNGLEVRGSIDELDSHDIDNSNLVNGKPLYYYKNEKSLSSNNFTNAGQVILVNCNNSNISNLDVSYANTGVALYFSNNNTILGINASNGYNGISLIESNNNSISGSTANYNFNNGIKLFYCDNIMLSGNTFNNDGVGISIFDGNETIITENTVKYNEYNGIEIKGNKNNILKNKVSSNGVHNFYGEGIRILGDNNIVSGNMVNNSENGILLRGDNCIISGNTVNNNTNGIQIGFYNHINNTIMGNIINNNSNGIFVLNSHYNNITKNIVDNNLVGIILVENSSGNLISENYANCNGLAGAVLQDSNNNIISGNIVNNNDIVGIGLINSKNNNITRNIANYNVLAGIALQDSNNNTIYLNTVDNNFWIGIGLNVSKSNLVLGNIVSNNEIGIYLELSCYNNVIGNIFINNTITDYYEKPESIDTEGPLIPGYYLILQFGILISVSLIFVGILSIEWYVQRKKLTKGKRKTLPRSKVKERLVHIKILTKVKTKPLNVSPEKVLQGKTLRVYWYILTHSRAGVREIQKSLKFSSPGTVSYQIDKLLKTGIISKSDKDGKYYVNKELKKGILGFYTHIGFLMIPRFSLYLVINVLGFIGYLIFASIYGDNFITNPGSILLLVFLIFGTAVFIFESIKVWKTRPSKSK